MRFAGRRGATGATGATGPRGVNAYNNGNNQDPTTTTTTTTTASTTGTHLRLSNTPTVNVTYTENKELSYRFSALEVFLNDMRYINPRFTYFTYLLTYYRRGTVRCVVSV